MLNSTTAPLDDGVQVSKSIYASLANLPTTELGTELKKFSRRNKNADFYELIGVLLTEQRNSFNSLLNEVQSQNVIIEALTKDLESKSCELKAHSKNIDRIDHCSGENYITILETAKRVHEMYNQDKTTTNHLNETMNKVGYIENVQFELRSELKDLADKFEDEILKIKDEQMECLQSQYDANLKNATSNEKMQDQLNVIKDKDILTRQEQELQMKGTQKVLTQLEQLNEKILKLSSATEDFEKSRKECVSSFDNIYYTQSSKHTALSTRVTQSFNTVNEKTAKMEAQVNHIQWTLDALTEKVNVTVKQLHQLDESHQEIQEFFQ